MKLCEFEAVPSIRDLKLSPQQLEVLYTVAVETLPGDTVTLAGILSEFGRRRWPSVCALLERHHLIDAGDHLEASPSIQRAVSRFQSSHQLRVPR